MPEPELLAELQQLRMSVANAAAHDDLPPLDEAMMKQLLLALSVMYSA